MKAVGWAWIGLGALFVFFFAMGSLPDYREIYGDVQNAAHAVFFGVVALIVLHILSGGRAAGLRDYGLAFGIALLLGAASELGQIFLDRFASIADFARDVAGAAGGLLLRGGIDRDLSLSTARRKTAFVAAALLALVVAFPVVRWVAAYPARERAVPRVCGFPRDTSGRTSAM